MEKNNFIEEVKEFQAVYFDEYMAKHQAVFDFDEDDYPTAIIKCEDFGGAKWDIPICLNESGEVGVDIGDAGIFSLDGQGLYCYLWHEAIARIT